MAHTQKKMVPVWDRFIRLFHWGLFGFVAIAAATGFLLSPSWINLHIWAGTAAGALILARLFWGIWGSKNARFAGFIKGPRVVAAHIAELRTSKAPRHLGHNPLGAVMIVALLSSAVLLLFTGAAGLGGVFKTGPFGFALAYDFGRTALSLHELLAIALMVLVALHIGGALFEGHRTKDSLVKAMIKGRKEARIGDIETNDVMIRPFTVVFLSGGSLALLFFAGVWLSAKPPYGMPRAAPNPVYADECSACHIAYAPSLLPAQNWSLLMAGLDEHFGEDASLDEETAADITSWLIENAANTVDSKPAHMFSRINPDNPLAITETPFWKRTHLAIPDAVFARPPIYDNGNCVACHSDARSGAFYPANISIPKETSP